MGIVPQLQPLSWGFTLERPPTSRRSARKAAEMIRTAALSVTGGEMPFGPDDALHVDVREHLHTGRVYVTVSRVGVLPDRRRRKGAHGYLETVLGALHGVWYPDSRQVDSGAWGRARVGGT